MEQPPFTKEWLSERIGHSNEVVRWVKSKPLEGEGLMSRMWAFELEWKNEEDERPKSILAKVPITMKLEAIGWPLGEELSMKFHDRECRFYETFGALHKNDKVFLSLVFRLSSRPRQDVLWR